MSKTRRAMAIAACTVFGVLVVAAVAWFGYWHVVDSRNPYGGHNSYGMRDYTPDVQQEAARKIVAGLNTGNPDRVQLVRYHGRPEYEAPNAAIKANITAVLPAPGCRYVLDAVEDKGEQAHPADLVPWYAKSVEHAWGFDMRLQQQCPGRQPTSRTIRVIAIAGIGGYWAEAALREQA
ncbi:hypothetical protein LV457_06865 [Mycobacterium sp. MYCO198283]|uniref:hypothetical protein n=1 Tax=Mycobacterium sp. MYCO198283 TaxID=2883505 RepID=UPI001E5E0BE1|nr:hypothetical protein [Mycobacterium sp. MYCO198283]MCG5432011.1 hypothetical protein [Mycobacterium sp. MYCO198283]